MNILQITKTLQASAQSSPREIKSEDTGKDTKSRVDSAEISGNHGSVFEDKRLSAFKSALLYELSTDAASKKTNDIKEQIDNGSYLVENDILANALID